MSLLFIMAPHTEGRANDYRQRVAPNTLPGNVSCKTTAAKNINNPPFLCYRRNRDRYACLGTKSA